MNNFLSTIHHGIVRQMHQEKNGSNEKSRPTSSKFGQRS